MPQHQTIAFASKTAASKSSSKDHQLGRLPTLGLSKYQAADFGDETRNPFYVQNRTEKMLVVAELQREVRDINKFEKDTLKVHQKNISTRQDRSGAVKEVAHIPEKKWNFNPSKKQVNRLQEIVPDIVFVPNRKKDDKKKQQAKDNAEDRDTGNKQKVNIFDAQDSDMMKND